MNMITVSYIAVCPPGYYGDRCNETCGACLGKSTCRHDTGQCETGCAEGFTGSLCAQGVPTFFFIYLFIYFSCFIHNDGKCAMCDIIIMMRTRKH